MLYASDPQSDDLMHTDDERELEVLSHVHRAQPGDGSAPAQVSQRSIAQALGMSVGLTNAILKRLIDKGFVMMRRINHNNVHYLVTPEGIDQIGKRSYLYLRRTIGHVVRYKERLRAFCHQQKQAGIEEIVLVGESDLTFLLEWCAEKEGLSFQQVMEPGQQTALEPSGSATLLAVRGGWSSDRGNGEGPPARVGVLTVLSERTAQEAVHTRRSAEIPLYEVVLGNR